MLEEFITANRHDIINRCTAKGRRAVGSAAEQHGNRAWCAGVSRSTSRLDGLRRQSAADNFLRSRNDNDFSIRYSAVTKGLANSRMRRSSMAR